MNNGTGIRINDVHVIYNGRKGYMFTNLKEMVMKYDQHFPGLRRPLPGQCFFHPIQGGPIMVQMSHCMRVTQNNDENVPSNLENNMTMDINSNIKSAMNSGSRLKTPRDQNSTSTIAPQLSLGQQQKSKIGSKLTISTDTDIVAFGHSNLLSKDDHPHSPPTPAQTSSSKNKSYTTNNINRDDKNDYNDRMKKGNKRDLDDMKTPGATTSYSSSSSESRSLKANQKKDKELQRVKEEKRKNNIQLSKLASFTSASTSVSKSESAVGTQSSPRRSKRTKASPTPIPDVMDSSIISAANEAAVSSIASISESNVNTDSHASQASVPVPVPVVSINSKTMQHNTSKARKVPLSSRSKTSPIKIAAVVKNPYPAKATAVRISARSKSSTSSTSVDEDKKIEKVEKVSSARTTRATVSSSLPSSSAAASISITKGGTSLVKSSKPKSLPIVPTANPNPNPPSNKDNKDNNKDKGGVKHVEVKNVEQKGDFEDKGGVKHVEVKNVEQKGDFEEMKGKIDEKQGDAEVVEEEEDEEEEEEDAKVNIAALESERWKKWQQQQNLQKQMLLHHPISLQSASIPSQTDISSDSKIEEISKTREFATIREGIAEARMRMQNAYAPGVVSGREEEYQQIHSFLEDGLVEGCGRSMYVCGASGIGKTMTMTAVLSNMLKQRDELHTGGLPSNKNKSRNRKDKDRKSSGLEINPDLPDFDYIRLQGTALDDPLGTLVEKLNLDASYSHDRGSRGRGGSRDNMDEKERFRHVLRQRLCPSTRSRGRKSNTASTSGKMVLLFIDEVDRSSRAGIRELFLLTSDPNSLLVLVGLANSIDFPNQLALPAESEPKIVVFTTYSADGLAAILQVRGIGLFESRACTFLARKFTDSSDVRRLLSAANRCMTQAESNLSAADLSGPMRPIVLMKDVALVVNSAGLSSIRVPKIIDDLPTGIYPLLTACIISNPDGQSMTLPQMEGYHSYYARKIGIPAMSRDEIRRYLNILEDNNLVSLKKTNRRVNPDKVQYRLTMKKDDLLKAKNLPKLHQEKLRSNKF